MAPAALGTTEPNRFGNTEYTEDLGDQEEVADRTNSSDEDIFTKPHYISKQI